VRNDGRIVDENVDDTKASDGSFDQFRGTVNCGEVSADCYPRRFELFADFVAFGLEVGEWVVEDDVCSA
jgi:hypothetical protein